MACRTRREIWLQFTIRSMLGIQSDLFREPNIARVPKLTYGLDDLILQSKDIVMEAILRYNPYAIVLMLSGGDDSITALQTALMLGIRIDAIIHGVTGTGLSAVRKYCQETAERHRIKFIAADAGKAFEDYVDRKGFFGVGVGAHKFSYHLLKKGPFIKAISKHFRRRALGRNILMLNGVRIEESTNRAQNYGDNPYNLDGANVWVNIIHYWEKSDCMDLIEGASIIRNPVAIALGRSGECNCGTMQNETARIACAQYEPEWGEWMNRIRKHAIQKHGWDIGQNPSKKRMAEVKAASAQMDDFMPMCVGCKAMARNQLQISL